MEVRLEARETKEATVTKNGNGAHVTVPAGWLGEEVLIIRKPGKTP